MSRYQGLRRAASALAAISLVALAGCGKQGALDRPPPLFGGRAKATYEAEKAQAAKDEAQRAAQRGTAPNAQPADNSPVTTRDIQDPAQVLSPASSSPISGAPNPMGAPVQTRPAN
jgi:predicted small lipoprotein YifL